MICFLCFVLFCFFLLVHLSVALEDAVCADYQIIVYLFLFVVGIVSLSVSVCFCLSVRTYVLIRLHESSIYYKTRNCLFEVHHRKNEDI